MNNRQVIDLSILSIIKFFLVVISLAFLYFVRDIIAVLFVAIIFAAAISPWVDYLENKKIPRKLSVVFFFLVFIGFVTLTISLLIPPITEQLASFSENLPQYNEKINHFVNNFTLGSDSLIPLDQLNTSPSVVQETISSSFGSVFSTIFGIFGGIIAFFGILVITFYLLVEEHAIKRTSKFLVPDKYQHFVMQMVTKIQTKISSWLKGQFVLSFIIGLLVFVSLLILDVEYALILALVAFIGEFVPYLGPILASIPAVFVAFVDSPFKALAVIVIFVIIQQAENHILVPKIMQKAVGLNPLISIISLLIGAKLAGLIGLILAIPVATAISVIIREIYEQQQLAEPIEIKNEE